ncbi:MAG: hypothetical protein J5871_01690, partial [Bacteroidales bacterium]|nr:hypothetical protein [Bacteroidales bacterium]
MKTFCLLLALLASGGPSFREAVLFFTGAGVLEELDESEMEKYRQLAAHPLDLNHAGRVRLLASGLLTPY